MKLKKVPIIGILVIILAVVVGVCIPYIIKEIVDGSNEIVSGLDNRLLLCLAFISNVSLSTFGSIIFVKLSEKNALKLKNEIINHLVDGKYDFFDNTSVGKIPSHLTNNVKVYLDYISYSIPSFVSGVFTIILSVIFLAILDWKLTLVLIGSLLLIAIIIIPISAISSKYADALQKSNAEFSEKLINIFENILYIKSINAQKQMKNKLNEYNIEIKTHSTKSRKLEAFIQPFILFVLLIIISLIFIYGGSRVREGSITVGVLVSFLVYVFQLLTPVTSFNDFFAQKAKVKTNLEELEKYIEIQEEELDGKSSLKSIERIIFQDVYFSYHDTTILNGLSLNIQKGEKIAIVGPSGAGKTTFYKLLLGLYEVQDGLIKINDVNIDSVSRKSLRNLISFIPQENSIVFSNLFDYFKLGNENVSETDVLNALDALSLKDELSVSEDNILNYDFGIGASKLSTGQKQRMMIAKAMTKNSDVYLLDESTSSVDAELESTIFQIQSKLSKDKILISITHRLSNVKYSDRVIFVEDGAITGNDTHENLFQSHEKYRHYIDLQNIET